MHGQTYIKQTSTCVKTLDCVSLSTYNDLHVNTVLDLFHIRTCLQYDLLDLRERKIKNIWSSGVHLHRLRRQDAFCCAL